MTDRKATVFEIREFTLHDGPGVRVTVFLKGCPLDCVWCHNPEGKSPAPQLMIKKSLCKKCGLCRKNRTSESFIKFGRDISSCPDGLISLCGEEMTPEELAARILPLSDMLRSMEGGVTFSGGEPLMYPDFIIGAADLFHGMGLSVAIETSGYASAEVFGKVAAVCDYIMMDLKLADPALHEKYTGKRNELILENAGYLAASGKDYEFRTPLIEGICDTKDNLEKIEEITKRLGAKWVKLPENKLARAKDDMLEI